MRKKINQRFMIIALFSIIVTTTVMTGLFYGQLERQVFSDLESVTDLLIEDGLYEKSAENLRITIIEEDGRVSFDSVIPEESLENHGNRPEVIEATRNGRGKDIRKSNTLSRSTFYFARKLPAGQVLRVGKESRSVLAVVLSTLPVILGVTLLLAGICMALSHFLATEIIGPIERMAEDAEYMQANETYPELNPFITKIRTQHEEILSSTNIRQEFTANVTHELKTPLAAISGYAELMEGPLLGDNDVKHFAGEIRKCSARLLALIDDILKLSELDAGNASEILDIVDLSEIARESVDMLSVTASKNQIKLTYEGAQVARVRIGKELAQELLYNLIINAVRYNRPGGSVKVCLETSGRTVQLVVEDTGIGIPKDAQERIFERFYRVDKSRSKELGGTGLGLAIVKHICTLTDGQIQLESDGRQGTRISVSWKAEGMG